MEKALDESMDLIGEMLQSVCKELSVESAAAYVTSEPLDLTADKLIRREVELHMSRFNHMTLHTINSLVQAPTVEANPEMKTLLAKFKEEIVKQTGSTLPKEMQQLETLLAIEDPDQRAAWIEELMTAEIEALALCAGQVVTDMEDADAVPDVPLLCRVLIAQEELFAALERLAPERIGTARPQRSALPRLTTAFVKELVPLAEHDKRRSAIAQQLNEGLKATKQRKKKIVGVESEMERVRPGSLLQVMHVLCMEFEKNPPKSTREDPAAMGRRLADVRADCLHVVREFSDGRLRFTA